MSQVITVIASITATPGEEKVVADAVKPAEREVKGEPGWESYVLHQNSSQPQQFIMLERWSSRQHLNEHEKAPAFQKLAAALNNRASLDVVLSQEVSAD